MWDQRICLFWLSLKIHLSFLYSISRIDSSELLTRIAICFERVQRFRLFCVALTKVFVKRSLIMNMQVADKLPSITFYDRHHFVPRDMHFFLPFVGFARMSVYIRTLSCFLSLFF